MIIEPSLSISTPLSLSFSLSCFRRERGRNWRSKVRFLRGRIIPIGNQNQKLLFSLSASFEAKKFPRSVNKIAGKKGRNFFVSTLSLSLSVCLFREKRDRRIFISVEKNFQGQVGNFLDPPRFITPANWKVARFIHNPPGSGHTIRRQSSTSNNYAASSDSFSFFFVDRRRELGSKDSKRRVSFKGRAFPPPPIDVYGRERDWLKERRNQIFAEREREREEGDSRINSNYRLEKKIDPLPAFSSLFPFSLPPLLFPFTAEIAADNAFHSRRAGENRNEKGNRVNYCAGIFSRWYSAPPRSQPFPRSSFSRPPPLDFSRLIIPSPPPFQASWTRLRRLSHPSAAFNRQRSRSKQRSVRVSVAGRGQERVRFIERSALDHFPVHRD